MLMPLINLQLQSWAHTSATCSSSTLQTFPTLVPVPPLHLDLIPSMLGVSVKPGPPLKDPRYMSTFIAKTATLQTLP